LQSFKNIRVDDFFCNFLDKRFCFFFLKLEQIFIFQRSPYGVDPHRKEKYSLRQSRYYVIAKDVSHIIDYYGADIDLRDDLYKKESYTELYPADLIEGMSSVPSDSFDIVICEQVLEHLHELAMAFKALERVLAPYF
jgi:SAM-dependent methyltransferase